MASTLVGSLATVQGRLRAAHVHKDGGGSNPTEGPPGNGTGLGPHRSRSPSRSRSRSGSPASQYGNPPGSGTGPPLVPGALGLTTPRRTTAGPRSSSLPVPDREKEKEKDKDKDGDSLISSPSTNSQHNAMDSSATETSEGETEPPKEHHHTSRNYTNGGYDAGAAHQLPSRGSPTPGSVASSISGIGPGPGIGAGSEFGLGYGAGYGSGIGLGHYAHSQHSQHSQRSLHSQRDLYEQGHDTLTSSSLPRHDRQVSPQPGLDDLGPEVAAAARASAAVPPTRTEHTVHLDLDNDPSDGSSSQTAQPSPGERIKPVGLDGDGSPRPDASQHPYQHPYPSQHFYPSSQKSRNVSASTTSSSATLSNEHPPRAENEQAQALRAAQAAQATQASQAAQEAQDDLQDHAVADSREEQAARAASLADKSAKATATNAAPSAYFAAADNMPNGNAESRSAAAGVEHYANDNDTGDEAEANEPLLHGRTTQDSQRRRRARDELDDVLIGTRVAEGHENFVTAYNMLTGIRFAVSKTTAKLDRPLRDSDFTQTVEEYFDPYDNGSKHYFGFKDYAPWVFRHLRELFGLDPADYLMSMTAKYIVSELGSPGKSGSFFYYSRDYRFIIKTIRHEEHKRLRSMLREYYTHAKLYPDTLLSQFYGLHRVRLPLGRKIHFVVMNNVFPALYEIHKRYDLKGSLLGRELRLGSGAAKPYMVYKDLDFLRSHERIVVGPEKRQKLIKQLEADVRFLERVNVMDYSLLVGIHDMKKGNAALDALVGFQEFGPSNKGCADNKQQQPTTAHQKHEFAELQKRLSKANPRKLQEFNFATDHRSSSYFYQDHGGLRSTDANNEPLDVVYYLGVIDFLTGYTFRKHVETFCKGLVHKRSELSAVPSEEYGDRFLHFMHGAIGPQIRSESTKRAP